MTELPKPDVIITHESDLDGLVAGVLLRRLARRLFELDVPLEAYHYQQWRQRELREPAAWVTDLGFEARLDKENWAVMDHHATDAVPTRAVLIHDVNKSAGLLCYELCQANDLGSPELDRLVHLNDVADLFLVDDPEFELASDVANLVKSYGFWNVHSLISGRLESLLSHPLLEVMAVKRRVEDPIGLAWSRENMVEISPTIGYVETLVGNTNVVVHHLLKGEAMKYPVLLTLFRRPNGQIFVSLRSRNGEALKVATQLQGGGHANACGAVLPRSVRSLPDAVNYLRQVLNPAPAKGDNLNSLAALFDSLEPGKA